MKNIFTEHPHAIGETYIQHYKFASYMGIHLILGGIASLIHALFPFLFAKTGSRFLLKMTHTFVERMPQVEQPVVDISELIIKKAKASSYADIA